MFNLLYLRTSCTRINVINKLQFVYQGLKGNSKVKDCTFYKKYHTSLKNSSEVTGSRQERKSKKEIDTLNPNTNIQNNVLLYKRESYAFYFLRFFGFGSLMLSARLVYELYNEKFKDTWETSTSIKEYIRINGFNILFVIYGALAGPLILWTVYIVCSRYVKYIILHKGGKEVSIITYHLFKEEAALKIPTREVQTVTARNETEAYISMKVKGRRLLYLIDTNGTFLNETLFDNTIGIVKSWNKH
ncbi:transmembrane protein 223 [Megalopta genalis]|uniref:transmembrane protein 223 n=1 Tax=Megalopta genalis TaxID=115081 RepID=UPI003FD0B1B9